MLHHSFTDLSSQTFPVWTVPFGTPFGGALSSVFMPVLTFFFSSVQNVSHATVGSISYQTSLGIYPPKRCIAHVGASGTAGLLTLGS